MSASGVSWMPYMIERVDRMRKWHKGYTPGIDHGVRPPEMIHKNIPGCVNTGAAGLVRRETVRVARIVSEADRPHPDGPWPKIRQLLSELVRDVPDEEARCMVEFNARELLSFVPDLQTKTEVDQ
jgi:hypothetical protein